LKPKISSRDKIFYSHPLSSADRFKDWLNYFSIAIIVVSLVIVVLEYITNRSLWADEVTLAYSIVTRDLSNLTAKILKHRQSAPVLYVYIVKILTLIGNNSEFWLRIYSFFAYLGTIFLSYRILKDLAKSQLPMIGAAYISSMMIMLYFANEFKQYMSDAFTVLLVVFLYERYLHKKVSLPLLFFLYSIILWLSFPAIFYIGGIAIVIFIRSIIQKNRNVFIQSVIGSIVVIASFIWQYFAWLKKASEDPDLIEHWDIFRFPIIPTSIDDLIRAARLIYGLALNINDYPLVDNIFRVYPVIIVILVGVGIVSLLKKFNEATLVLISGTIILMIASFVGKYPFHPRLILFMYPIIAIVAVIAIEFIAGQFDRSKLRSFLTVFLVFVLFSGNITSLSLFQPENRLRQNEEARPLVFYVKENIEPDEYLYISGADMSLKYLNGYENLHIGDRVDPDFENIRYGSLVPGSEESIDLEKFAQSNAYILISHANFEKIVSLVEPLLPYGYIEKVMDVAQTPLFYHAQDLHSLKVAVEYELIDVQFKNNKLSGVIVIHNSGKSYLNAAELPPLILASRKMADFKVGLPEQDVKPGQSIRLDWEMEINDAGSAVDLQLMYQDQYWFDQLDIAPLLIIPRDFETNE